MHNIWQLQEAKNRLSLVVNQAQHYGPQTITRRGHEEAVVLAFRDYQKLTKPKEGLVEFLQASPLHGLKLDLSRSKETAREIEL